MRVCGGTTAAHGTLREAGRARLGQPVPLHPLPAHPRERLQGHPRAHPAATCAWARACARWTWAAGPGAFADLFAGRPVRRRRPERALHRARADASARARSWWATRASSTSRPPRSTRCSSSACCTISPTTTRARSWERCAGCSCPADALLVIEDIPAISKLNLIGHLIHNVENGEHIRPTEDYRRLYAEAARVEREEVLQSGICDYYAAVLVTPSS